MRILAIKEENCMPIINQTIRSEEFKQIMMHDILL